MPADHDAPKQYEHSVPPEAAAERDPDTARLTHQMYVREQAEPPSVVAAARALVLGLIVGLVGMAFGAGTAIAMGGREFEVIGWAVAGGFCTGFTAYMVRWLREGKLIDDKLWRVE